ncbi:MAG: beta-propeller domain-containing protein [Firmicutes bacterium]|nr:beta-propeller domain-containing protein [Bacillota bacterium]
MTDKNLDFIRDKFEKDGLRVPESLSEGSIQSMLEQDAPARKHHWRPIVAVAACAVLAIGMLPFLRSMLPGGPADSTDYTAEANGLVNFESYQDLDKEMKGLLSGHGDSGLVASNPNLTDGAIREDEVMEMAGEDAASTSMAASPSASSAPAHSQTYTQVEGIDEADIVKTDGNYIYYLSSAENQIIIAKASKGKARRISAVTADESGYIHDIFIRDGQLIILSGDWKDLGSSLLPGENQRAATTVTIYDVSDPANPRQTSSYGQTGSYLNSRLIDGQLCLVTNEMMMTYKKGKMLPGVVYADGDLQDLPIEDICSFARVSTPAFTVVGLMDLESGKVSKDSVKTKAVLGCSDEIYCNGENLYVTASAPDSGAYVIGSGFDTAGDSDAAGDIDGDMISFPEYSPNWQTQVLKVSLADGKVRFLADATVDGSVNDQFSMDEKDGILRIATTSTVDGTDVNNLFLLDEKMKELGSCRGFARDEHIEAVRYIRDKAYVITYEETDPLFIIDLSDPTNPVIEGHVKISGFSTLLVPCDADHMLGLGFSTETTEFGEATDGVKLALFDISDPSSPAVADSKEFPDMYSQVQYDHKALLVGPDADYYAIPYDHYSDDWIEDDPASNGILVFSAKAGKLRTLKDCATSSSVSRCIYIDDYIYGICNDDTIEGFQLK